MSIGGVSVVIVSYNVRDLLLQCLDSLQQSLQSRLLAEIVVVDNGSHDDSPEAVGRTFPEIIVIQAENLGYGAGANRGIAATTAEFVLILNPDTVVPPATVERLSRFLSENPSVAIAAPRMRYPDGAIQSSRRRFPTRLTPVFESTILDRMWPENRWSRRYRMRDREETCIQLVDWVVGACLLVRRSAIDSAGEFDESFWMYCEEVEWCWRLRQHGWRVAYVSDVEIVHHEGASTGQDIFRRQLAFDRSRVELQRRLYGPGTARLVACGIKAGYVLETALESAKYLVGHRRDLRRARIRNYFALIGSSLTSGAGRESMPK